MADPADALTEEIMKILPSIDDTLLQSLMGRLMSLGVETVDDLGLLQERDLEGFLKPIQIRKILASGELTGYVSDLNAEPYLSYGGQWNIQRAKRSSSQSEPSSPVSGTASASPLSSLGPPSPIFFENSTNTDPNWAYKVDVPWTKMGRDITDPLHKEKRLMPDARRKLVRIIVDEIRERTFHATKSQFSVVAKRIVQMFPKSLEDRIEDIIVGTGYDSFAKQLLNRNDNLNRPMGVKMGVKASDTGEKTGEKNEVQAVGETSKKKDSYGCINFSPSLNNDAESLEEIRVDMCRKHYQNPKTHDWDIIETQLRETYSLQRHNINEGESVRDLLSKWPFLFTERGLFLHFKLLVGLDIRNTICEAFSKKAHRLNKFFKTEESGICKETDELIKEAKAQTAKDSVIAWLPANILAIMKYFSEKEEELFLTVDDTSTRSEVEDADTDGLPRIVCSGRSVMEAKKFRIVVDRVVVLSDLTSFITSLSALFALFYILNIQYQQGASATLEFIQRCFVGINPDRGSKSDRKRKSSCAGSVNAKVLRLINQMANFEWTTC